MKGEYALIHRPVYLFLKHCKHTFENLDPPQKKSILILIIKWFKVKYALVNPQNDLFNTTDIPSKL